MNAVVDDEQARGEYLGACRARFGEVGQALHVREAVSDEKRVCSTLRPQNDGDIVGVPPPDCSC